MSRFDQGIPCCDVYPFFFLSSRIVYLNKLAKLWENAILDSLQKKKTVVYPYAEIGRDPVSKHQIQPEYGDEHADARRDCRTRLARPNSQARTRTGKYSFFLFS